MSSDGQLRSAWFGSSIFEVKNLSGKEEVVLHPNREPRALSSYNYELERP